MATQTLQEKIAAKTAAAKPAAAAVTEKAPRKPQVRRPVADVLADKKALLGRVEAKYKETVERLNSQIAALENKASIVPVSKEEAIAAVKAGVTRASILAAIAKQKALLASVGDVTEEDLAAAEESEIPGEEPDETPEAEAAE